MTRFINCDYCGQRNCLDALCCEFCGAPMPILIPGEITKVLEVSGHEMQTYVTRFGLCSSTAAIDLPDMSGLCTTAGSTTGDTCDPIYTPYEPFEYKTSWVDPDPPKRGWREWLGIGGR